MSFMNLLISLNGYQDGTSTNNPSFNNFKWTRQMQGISISDPVSKSITLAAGDSVSLVSGSVTLSSDATTTYDIALKSGTTNTYVISHNTGTAPVFRTGRTTGADATTEVTVTKNATLLTFSSTAGTALDLIVGGVVVGDEVRLGDGFNELNQGKYKVLAVTATSFTIENSDGVAETVVLGADFADDLTIHSSSGVLVGDQIDITSGFSLITQGTYEITDAGVDFIEIFSSSALPSETGVSNNPDAFLIYRDAKQFLYLESDVKTSIAINGSATANEVEPFTVGSDAQPGVFMSRSSIKSAVITNDSTSTANIFYITAEL